jgi:hypothetical protein
MEFPLSFGFNRQNNHNSHNNNYSTQNQQNHYNNKVIHGQSPQPNKTKENRTVIESDDNVFNNHVDSNNNKIAFNAKKHTKKPRGKELTEL